MIDHLVDVSESDDRSNRAKDLLASDRRIECDVAQHGRLEEAARPIEPMTTSLDFCAGHNGSFDEPLDFVDRSLVDQRATFDPCGQAWPDRDRTHRRCKLCRELLDNPSLNKEAVRGRACLR